MLLTSSLCFHLRCVSDLEVTEAVFVDAFALGVRRSYAECCTMINRVPEIEVADPVEVCMYVVVFAISICF